MFNNQKTSTNRGQKRTESGRDLAVTILTNGCHFSGKLYCRGSTRIGGKIDGEIISEGLLIIEEEALINADIKADEAVIQGKVNGKLTAKGRVELCSSSVYKGDIITSSLVIKEGAHFNGRACMDFVAEESKKAQLKGGGKAKSSKTTGATGGDVPIIKVPNSEASL